MPNWDERYRQQGYVFGEAPNAFLASLSRRFKPGWRALAPGDGEGRNGVYLAQLGLQVLSVDFGEGPLQVVCGAPNARAGLVGVLGLPGAVVPANGMTLKVAAVRGIESNGMMCSTRELELGDDHDGIIELPADAPIGTSFAEEADLPARAVERVEKADDAEKLEDRLAP